MFLQRIFRATLGRVILDGAMAKTLATYRDEAQATFDDSYLEMHVSLEALTPGQEGIVDRAQAAFDEQVRRFGRFSSKAFRAGGVLASELAAVGSFESAEALLREQHSLLVEARGCGHPDLAPALSGLAVCELGRGDLQQAAQTLAKAESLGGDVLDPMFHIKLLTAKANLASQQGEHEKSLRLFRQAYERQSQVSGVGSHRCRVLAQACARQLVRLERFAAAAAEFKTILANMGTSKDTLILAKIHLRIGSLTGYLGSFDEAVDHLELAYRLASPRETKAATLICLEVAKILASFHAKAGDAAQATVWRERRDAHIERRDQATSELPVGGK